MAFLWLLPSEHKANETKDNKNGTSLFAELKLLYANSVWITKNNVKANIWKLYMKFEANKEFKENLSLQDSIYMRSARFVDFDVSKREVSETTGHLTQNQNQER